MNYWFCVWASAQVHKRSQTQVHAQVRNKLSIHLKFSTKIEINESAVLILHKKTVWILQKKEEQLDPTKEGGGKEGASCIGFGEMSPPWDLNGGKKEQKT